MLKFTRIVFLSLNGLNWVVGLLICIMGFVVTFPLHDHVMANLAADGITDPAGALRVMGIMAALTPFIIAAVHLICRRIIAIIDTVAEGQAFSLVNARRLRTVGWALLVTQVADLALGVLVPVFVKSTENYWHWSFGFTGWLAVLLLFVLARVFQQGAAMREELDGTV